MLRVFFKKLDYRRFDKEECLNFEARDQAEKVAEALVSEVVPYCYINGYSD